MLCSDGRSAQEKKFTPAKKHVSRYVTITRLLDLTLSCYWIFSLLYIVLPYFDAFTGDLDEMDMALLSSSCWRHIGLRVMLEHMCDATLHIWGPVHAKVGLTLREVEG